MSDPHFQLRLGHMISDPGLPFRHICMYEIMYVCMNIYIYTYVQAYIYIYIYIYISVSTYTSTHIIALLLANECEICCYNLLHMCFVQCFSHDKV